MPSMSLGEQIANFVAQENSILFLGAGVGARVKLPNWTQYIEHLAAVCDTKGEDETAALIRQRAAKGQLASAATVYKTCESIPIGERLKLLAAPFLSRIPEAIIDRLHPLVGLGATGIVTTNYDVSLHDAYAGLVARSALPAELDDDSLKGQSMSGDFFIARIHGRAQIPSSMVVSSEDYARLETNTNYAQFLLDVLRRRPCLFIGFSFVDPSIHAVLKLFEDRVGPHFPTQHLALLPDNADALANRLAAFNIEVKQYSAANEHEELWRFIRQAYETRVTPSPHGPVPPSGNPSAPRPTTSTQHLMAFAYAQMQSESERQSLTDIVNRGVILSILADAPQSTLRKDALLRSFQILLALGADDATVALDRTLESLRKKGSLSFDGDRITSLVDNPSALNQHMTTLAERVVRRMRVRVKIRTGPPDAAAAREVLENLFMARAWDVAAHFAGAATGWYVDPNAMTQRLVAEQVHKRKGLSAPAELEYAIVDLISRPEPQEEEILAEIGRATFGLQILLSSPRQALFHDDALPEVLYVDANVLMPAITDGHPHRALFLEVIQRLVFAAKNAKTRVEVVVGQQFLEEVISHRRNAIQLARELRLDDPTNLERHVSFYSATNTNVYIGAYATFVGKEKVKLPFDSFIARVAPYKDEQQLIDFVQSQGVDVAPMDFRHDDNPWYVAAYNKLKLGYEQFGRTKETILISHEAQQIVQLRLDQQEGQRVLFVTADAQLRRIINHEPSLHDVRGAVVSHIGLMALVDVLVGLSPDKRGLARLVWAPRQGDEEHTIFNYLTSRVLTTYGEALDRPFQDIVAEVARGLRSQAGKMSLDVFSKSSEDILRTSELLDRYENDLFERLEKRLDH